MVILVSLPLCCGVFKLYGKARGEQNDSATSSVSQFTAKRVKKRGNTSSGTSSDSKSEDSSEKSVELFGEEQKIRRMGRAAPGALTCAAFRDIQNSLLTGTGGVWNPEEGVIPPIACQYYRQCMQQRLQGGQAREALTVAWTLDLLLQGRVSEACDTLTQRFKSLEMSGAGASWAISQKVELAPPEKPVLSSRPEMREAIRENREEQKTRPGARPPGRKEKAIRDFVLAGGRRQLG
ncbi:unnamed protein product [Durusdinium trenchii]|uniref:Uncharacterized protein n=1 Tax=Durusdinium trenchii TaxID=1381693 RepID=A0ABP0SYK5_9DINO